MTTSAMMRHIFLYEQKKGLPCTVTPEEVFPRRARADRKKDKIFVALLRSQFVRRGSRLKIAY